VRLLGSANEEYKKQRGPDSLRRKFKKLGTNSTRMIPTIATITHWRVHEELQLVSEHTSFLTN
jgi:predicted nuclease of restriction endonuclease-like RecB superfamily